MMDINEGRNLIDPRQARDILEQCSIPEQDGRNKTSKTRVLLKVEAMKCGIWRPNSQISFARFDGKLFLIDGYGRLGAVVIFGTAVMFDVSVHDVDARSDIGRLWATFDEGALNVSRSRPQSLRALGIADELGIHATRADAVLKAMPTVANGMRIPTSDVMAGHPDWKLQATQGKMAMEWVNEARDYDRATSRPLDHLRKSLLTTPAIAVGLQSFRHQPEIAQKFWDAVAHDTGRPDSAEASLSMALHRKRLQTEFNAGLLIIAAAWNAFFDRRPLSKIVVGQTGLLTLKGTPIKNVPQFSLSQGENRIQRREVDESRRRSSPELQVKAE